MQRDTKGLYKKAIRGEITDFTGISAPYFPPAHPDVIIDTATLSVKDCTRKIFTVLKNTR